MADKKQRGSRRDVFVPRREQRKNDAPEEEWDVESGGFDDSLIDDIVDEPADRKRQGRRRRRRRPDAPAYDPDYGVEDSGYGMEDSGYGMEDSGYGMSGSRYGMDGSDYGMEDSGAGYGMDEPGYGAAGDLDPDLMDDVPEPPKKKQRPSLKTSLQKKKKPEQRENSFRKKRGNVIDVGGDPELRKRNLANRQQRRTSKVRLIVLLSILVIVIGVVWFVYREIREFRGYKVLSSQEMVLEANAEYTEFGGNLLKLTQEGVTYINENGDVVWTAGANIKVPICSTCGEYAVVAEKGGNAVHVFNTQGPVSDLVMPYKIIDIAVASQGAFTVVLESDTTNYVNMYDKEGKPVYEMQTSIDKSGYPLDIAISNDGQKLFTSYFFMDGIKNKNNLAAYNFGEVGQNANADRMVGGFSLEDELVAKVEFTTNDTVAAFSDKGIQIYSMKEKPSKQAEIRYENEIRSIFYSDSYVGTIEHPTDASMNTDYLMRVYDFNGKEIVHFSFNMAYDNIHAGKDEIILTGGTQCMVITKKGRVKFRYSFDTVLRSMIPTSSGNEYVVTFEGKTEKIGLRMEDE